MRKKERIREKFWNEKDPKNDLDYVEVSLPDESIDAFIQHYALASYLRTEQMTPEEQSRAAERRARLLRKIMKAASLVLTDRQFQIFTLRHVTGLKEVDIAQQVEVNQSYISSVLHTSYKKIKKALRLKEEAS